MAEAAKPARAAKKAAPKKAATVLRSEPLPADTPPADLPPDLRIAPEPEPDEDETPPVPGAKRVPFADSHVWVLDPEDWPSSANEAIFDRRFNLWATKALARDVDVALWLTVDPKKRVVDEFFGEWHRVRGVEFDDDSSTTRRAMLRLAQ